MVKFPALIWTPSLACVDIVVGGAVWLRRRRSHVFSLPLFAVDRESRWWSVSALRGRGGPNSVSVLERCLWFCNIARPFDLICEPAHEIVSLRQGIQFFLQALDGVCHDARADDFVRLLAENVSEGRAQEELSEVSSWRDLVGTVASMTLGHPDRE
jgi:hypothetical protein